jgi:spermidine synthase
LVLLLPADLHLVRLPPGARVRDYRDGVMATVAVIETPDGQRSLRVNNRFQMGGTAAALAERRQAHIPLLLHPAPKRALFLGPGTGITLGAAKQHPGLIADGVELVPEVIELMHHFAPENMGVGSSTPVVAADARRFVRASDERYDVIVADLFHPAQDGAGFLYTREHFEAVRQRLAPGGIFCQWLPLHQLDEPTLNTILRTFLHTFPETHAVLLHFNVDIPVVGLIGSLDPLHLAPESVERRLAEPAFRQQMKSAGLDRTINLLGCLAAGPRELSSLAGPGLLNTDDRPVVSFAAPRIASRRDRPPHELLLSCLARCRVAPAEILTSSPESAAFESRLSDFIAARDLYLHGLAIESEGRLPEAMDRYLESTGRSLYFIPAYARLVSVIQVMAGADRESARRLFERLQKARPDQPLGQQILGPLFKAE